MSVKYQGTTNWFIFKFLAHSHSKSSKNWSTRLKIFQQNDMTACLSFILFSHDLTTNKTWQIFNGKHSSGNYSYVDCVLSEHSNVNSIDNISYMFTQIYVSNTQNAPGAF